MELEAGIEPATSSLPRRCSTTELLQQPGVLVRVWSPTPLRRRDAGAQASPRTYAQTAGPPSQRHGADQVQKPGSPAFSGVERAMGIEPTSAAWKAAALPLSYARRQRHAVRDLSGEPDEEPDGDPVRDRSAGRRPDLTVAPWAVNNGRARCSPKRRGSPGADRKAADAVEEASRRDPRRVWAARRVP